MPDDDHSDITLHDLPANLYTDPATVVFEMSR